MYSSLTMLGCWQKLYKYADIAYVGGGFGTEGIHNVLEAAVYGKPVVFWPGFIISLLKHPDLLIAAALTVLQTRWNWIGYLLNYSMIQHW